MDDVPAVTLTLWRLNDAGSWSHGVPVDPPAASDGDDGGSWLFDQLDGEAQTYVGFALDYYEVSLPLAAVEHVFAHRPLTEDVVRALNADVTLEELADDVRGIGYPAA